MRHLRNYLANWDPMGFIQELGAPADEYDAEADQIVKEYRKGMTDITVARLIVDVFTLMFEEVDDAFIKGADSRAKDIKAILDGVTTQVDPPVLWFSVNYVLQNSKAGIFVSVVALFSTSDESGAFSEAKTLVKQKHGKDSLFTPVYLAIERVASPMVGELVEVSSHEYHNDLTVQEFVERYVDSD